MSTLVCFHAHPDDEALGTGGLMAKAAKAGHRVVLVTATRGEQGEPKPGVLEQGEALRDRRVAETIRACEILGADPPYFLGYEDSGMVDTETNNNPLCFWQADIGEAAARLAEILEAVGADVMTIYDDHGLYGHPDHIQVHRVGLAAAKLVGRDLRVFESTVNRDRALEAFEKMAANAPEGQSGPSAEEMTDFGVPEKDLVYFIDVSPQIDFKRAAMAAHASQISEEDFFLQIPEELFGQMFGTEWFAEPGRSDTGGPVEIELLPGL